MHTKNVSLFYAPIWVEEYADLVRGLKGDSRFVLCPKDNPPQYLLPYATQI